MENSFNTENERLRHLMKVLNFSNQTEFAVKLGMTQGGLSNVFVSKKGIGVSDTIKRILEKEYSINIEWLETGAGSILNEPENFLREPPALYDSDIGLRRMLLSQQEVIASLIKQLEKQTELVSEKQAIINDLSERLKLKEADMRFAKKESKGCNPNSAVGEIEGRQAV